MLHLSHVMKRFSGTVGERLVIPDLSLDVTSGSFATLVGPNGCGKSTLLNLIAGLMPMDAGTITIDGLNKRQPQIGYVRQDYRASLLPWLSVAENIAFPLRIRGIQRNERRAAAVELVSAFLPSVDPRVRCYDLSGGQQQLVNLLRCAIAQPDVYLLDEPFSALDQERRWATALYVEKLWTERRVPTIFVSHDVDEAILLGDVIHLMKRSGQITASICNPLPRPRSIRMLTTDEHLRCRREIIEFLVEQSAVTLNGDAKRDVPPRRTTDPHSPAS